MIKLFIFFSLFILCSPTFAVLRITGITGYSNIKDFNTTLETPAIKIYGGFGGSDSSGTCATKDDNSTCNSCTDDYVVCNMRRAYPSLKVKFSFFSTTNLNPGTPMVTWASSTSSDTVLGIGTSVTGDNQTREVQVTWAQLCGANTTADSTCATDGTSSIKVGIDKNNNNTLSTTDGDEFQTVTVYFRDGTSVTGPEISGSGNTCTAGLCNFKLTAGDEKAYVENVTIATLTGGSAVATKAHFLCTTGDNSDTNVFSTITATDICATLDISGSSLAKDTITNLTNDQTYFFRVAIEDDSGNIGLFSQLDGDNDADGTTVGADAADLCPDGVNTGCHKVTPSAVIGLFENKQNCFIATAAFGSPLHPHVVALKKFRGDFLMPYSWGRSFVRWYYKTGPAWAQWIQQSSPRLFWTRILLTPVILFAYLMIYWPWTLFAAIFAVTLYFIRQRKVWA